MEMGLGLGLGPLMYIVVLFFAHISFIRIIDTLFFLAFWSVMPMFRRISDRINSHLSHCL